MPRNPRTQGTTRTGVRVGLQKQVQGQKRTALVREEMDRLDVAPDPGPGCGATWLDTDLGAGDELDGDDLLHDDPDAPDATLAPDAEDPDQPEPPPRAMPLTGVIGSRPPSVLFRLAAEG